MPARHLTTGSTAPPEGAVELAESSGVGSSDVGEYWRRGYRSRGVPESGTAGKPPSPRSAFGCSDHVGLPYIRCTKRRSTLRVAGPHPAVALGVGVLVVPIEADRAEPPDLGDPSLGETVRGHRRRYTIR